MDAQAAIRDATVTLVVSGQLRIAFTFSDGVAQFSNVPFTQEDATYPLVKISRVTGGAGVHGHLDRPLIQIDVLGSSTDDPAVDSALQTIVEDTRSSIFHLPWTHPNVTLIEETTGPGDMPDPVSDRPRRTWDVRLTTHS